MSALEVNDCGQNLWDYIKYSCDISDKQMAAYS